MARLNFTGRRRISQNHVQIRVTGIGGIETFQVDLNLEKYLFPSDARVVVEAWRQLELIRFEFGTVGNLTPPSNCRLSEFGTAAGVRFRVKVISSTPPRGRLLGVADRILPKDEHRASLMRVPLLAVRTQDLGREIWRVDFSEEPILLINSRCTRGHSLVQSPEFQALVLPEILRSILTRILRIENIRSVEENDDWTGRWLQFAISLPGTEPPSQSDDSEADDHWIETVVGSFCRWRGVDRLLESAKSESSESSPNESKLERESETERTS